MPALAIFLDADRRRHLTDKPSDGTLPKLFRRMIRLHHTHFPSPRVHPPYFMRYFHAETTSPISTNNEELCHVPDILITRDLRLPLHQYKTRYFAIYLDKIRMSVRLFPV